MFTPGGNTIGSTRTRLISVISVLVVIAIALGTAPFGLAQTLEQNKEQAQQDVTAQEQRLESAVERLKFESDKLARTMDQIEENKVQLTRTERELAARQATLGKRARAMYVSRPTRFIDVVVNSKNFDQFVVGLDLLKRVGRNDAVLVASVKGAKAHLESARQNLQALKDEQEAATREVASLKATIEAELSQAKGRLASAEQEIRLAIARQAQEAAAAAGRYSSSGAYPYVLVNRSGPPGAPHPEVVAVARAQLGKPYVWGATGPDSFDCSGLTSYCYRVGAGMVIPRDSYGQSGLPAVGVAELQPGDILGFHGWGHVGLYAGGDQYIQAPHTGDVVKVSVLSGGGGFAGAVRP